MDCKNCKKPLANDDHFCNECGAKVIRNRLTIRNLFENFSEQFLNYDNKFLQTFLDLFRKPVEVIGGYINGVRKKYVNVVSYFAIAITISGLQIFILTKYFPEAMDVSSLSQPGTEDFQRQNMEFTIEYQSLMMMLYVPMYALIGKIVFWGNKKYNYSEMLVIFMYTMAQFSIIGALLVIPFVVVGLDFAIISVLLLPAQIIYSAYCLKKLYELSLSGIILKSLIFFIVLFVIGMIFSGILLYVWIQDGTFQKVLEAQKEAREATSYIISSAINWTS